MKQFIIIMLLFFAATALAEQDPAGLRPEALNLRQTLQANGSLNFFPEEYDSFSATVDAAEKLHKQGDTVEAEQLFSLAVMKGELLLKRKSPPHKSLPYPGSQTSNPAFSILSSSANIKQEPPAITGNTTTGNSGSAAEEPYLEEKISDRIIGGKGIYTVLRKESLKLVASRLGVRLKDIARMNYLKTDTVLHAGQKLKYNNRRIVPKSIKNGIVVNIPDRSLYLFRNGKVSASYPVALGISKKKESTIWRTPVGKFRIVDKKENPTWRIPPSIQKEMEENGEEVMELIPPGPKNPLGKYALRTDLSGILIHSTTRPASINSYSSHGCIRVMPEHMERLFKSVSVPMSGEIVYQPVKVEVTRNGRVFLQVDNDSYEKIEDIPAEVRRVISKYRAENRVSWERVNRVINEKTGIAEDVSLSEMPD